MAKKTDVVGRLDRWLARNRPEYYACLRPGLTGAQVAELERFVGYPFPETFRAFYRWRNGQPGFAEPVKPNDPFIDSFWIMGADEVRSDWRFLTEMLEGGGWQQPQWWCRGWVPFLHNGAGSYLCLDLQGSFTGRKGQVLEYWNHFGDRPIVAPSFEAWLGHLLDLFDAGFWKRGAFSGNLEEALKLPAIPGYPVVGDSSARPKAPPRKKAGRAGSAKKGPASRAGAAASPDERFREAILADPEDDAPRLVYADWLEERGDPRGEFIRLQCRLAALPEDDAHWPELKQREGELLEAHGKAWLRDVPAWARRDACFRRGLVGEVRCTPQAFVRGAGLFRRAPVRAVQFRDLTDEQVRALAESPDLARLTELDLDLGGTDVLPAAVTALLISPHLGRLTRLAVTSLREGGVEVARSVAQCPALRGLTALDLAFNEIGSAGARALAGSPNLKHLVALNLHWNHIGDFGVRYLFGSRHLGRLRELDLRHNDLTARGARALAAAPALTKLANLELESNRIGTRGAQALAASPHLTRLTRLQLNMNHIGPAGARALAGSPILSRVRFLFLASNPIGSAGARALAKSPYLGALTCLDVWDCGLAEADMERLRQRFGREVTE
jgi:uncharacterized protein (TIGR02996 family)